jgi:hypothetical protein
MTRRGLLSAACCCVVSAGLWWGLLALGCQVARGANSNPYDAASRKAKAETDRSLTPPDDWQSFYHSTADTIIVELRPVQVVIVRVRE